MAFCSSLMRAGYCISGDVITQCFQEEESQLQGCATFCWDISSWSTQFFIEGGVWGGSVSKQVFILGHHTGLAEVILVPPHCSKSGVSLAAFGNITLAISVWHALFLVLCVCLAWRSSLCGPRTPCKAVSIATLQRGMNGCSLYGLVRMLQRCCQFLEHGHCHVSKLIAHFSSCHGYRFVCACLWEEMNAELPWPYHLHYPTAQPCLAC